MTNGKRFQIGYRLAMLSLTAKRNGMLEENCSPKEKQQSLVIDSLNMVT